MSVVVANVVASVVVSVVSVRTKELFVELLFYEYFQELYLRE